MNKKIFFIYSFIFLAFLVGIGSGIAGSFIYRLGWSTFKDQLFAAVTMQKTLDRPILSAITTSCNGKNVQAGIAWTQVTGAATYTISKQSPGNTGWPQIASQSSTSYIDTSFSLGPGIYNYQVKVSASNMKASYSNTQSVRIPSCVVVIPIATSTPPIVVTPPVTPPQPIATTTTPVFNQKEWGAYVGWEANDMATFENQTSKTTNDRAVFIHWGNENQFPFYLSDSLKPQGKTLVIFWEATDYNNTSVNQPRFNFPAIIAGNWDSYIATFAADAKAYGGPVIIVPFSEMNGNWFSTGGTVNGNSSATFIAAYRHLQDMFKNATNVKFGWAPNNDSVPDIASNQLEKYYPGDVYVDYVGVDGFNDANPWMSFDQMFGSVIKRLEVYNKPMYIFSFASAEGPQKAAWITDALTVQIPKYSDIKGWIWFNELKEHDWRVWSDSASLTAFKAAIK